MTEFLAIRKRAEAAKIFIKNEAGIKTEVKAEGDSKNAVENENEEDDDDDESDEDFDPDAVDEDASGIDSDDSRYSDEEGGGDGNEDANMSDDEGTRNIPRRKKSRIPSAEAKKNRKRAADAESKTLSTVKEESSNEVDGQDWEHKFIPGQDSPNIKKMKLEHGL